MVRRWMLVLGFVFFIAAAAYAEPPKIIKGYGLTEWGQSVEQVKKLVPNLKEVTPDVRNDLISEYVVPAQEPFKEIRYGFADDKLFNVNLTLSNRVKEEVGDSFIQKLISQKYGGNKENQDLLHKEEVSVWVKRSPKSGDLIVYYAKPNILRFAEEKAKKEQEMKRQEVAKELRLEDLL